MILPLGRYLALLETKPEALNHARPLLGWTLAECFVLLRRRLEAERDGDGTWELIFSRAQRQRKGHRLSAAFSFRIPMGIIKASWSRSLSETAVKIIQAQLISSITQA